MNAAAPARASLAPFQCPRCAGQLSVREGTRISRCHHCGTSLLARGLLRYAVEPSLGRRQAEALLRRLLKGPEAPPDLAGKALRQRTDLFFVPYWRFQATVVGRLRGTRTVRRRGFLPDTHSDSPGWTAGREITREENVNRPVHEHWRATLSACPVEELGIPSLTPLRQRSAGMMVTRSLDGIPGLRFFDASLFDQGIVLDVMLPLDQARDRAEQLYRRFIETRGFDVSERQLRVMKLQERCHLLYYPVYRVRFRYAGRIYGATLDGLQGSVIRAHLPVEPRSSVAALQGAALLGSAVAAVPLRLVLFPPEGLQALAGLAGDPRFWSAAAIGGAALLAAGRIMASRLRFERERVVQP